MELSFQAVVDALGGGPSAVSIVGLSIAVVALWRRTIRLEDRRSDDQKEHTGEILEAMRAIDRAIDYVEKRRD